MNRTISRRTALAALGAVLAGPAKADEALWALLKAGGQVVLIRHAATAPGVGDPEGMKLDDCSSQRNLSDAGRRDAKRMGAILAGRGVRAGRLLSSPWCRCRETARLAFGREPEVHPALGNLFGRPQLEAQQVAQLQALVARKSQRGNLFLVTHGSTTRALTGVSPATGEMVVLTPLPAGGFKVAGRLSAT